MAECLALREQLIPNDPLTMFAKRDLGQTQLRMGKVKASRPLIEEAYFGLVALKDKLQASEKNDPASCLNLLILVCEKQNETEAVEKYSMLMQSYSDEEREHATKWREKFEESLD